MRDLYQEVTDRIIAELEQGTAPWIKPWKSGSCSAGAMPYNAATGKHYRGVNIPLLMSVGAAYGSPAFLTFKQALDLGGHVRKGERGCTVVFWKFLQVTDSSKPDPTADDGDSRLVPMARAYTVFNVAQCDGITAPAIEQPKPINPDQRAAELDAAIDATGARITYGNGGAYYSPAADAINLPPFELFKTASDYYATAFHELAHWTAHKSRLARDLSGRFGSQAYAAEELVAELGAAFLCAARGVTGQLQHASYLDNWIKVLKSDKRAIFTAASKAQQAADYLTAAMQRQPLALAA